MMKNLKYKELRFILSIILSASILLIALIHNVSALDGVYSYYIGIDSNPKNCNPLYYASSSYSTERTIAISNWNSLLTANSINNVSLSSGTYSNRHVPIQYTTYSDPLIFGWTKPVINGVERDLSWYERWGTCNIYIYPTNISTRATQLGYPSSDISTFITKVIAHEFGHVFGLGESYSVDSNGVPLSLMVQGLGYLVQPLTVDLNKVASIW